VGLVERHREEFGLNRCLAALGVSKSTWHYRQRRGAREAESVAEEARLKEQVIDVVEDHPAYGYRRLLPELHARGEQINHKRLRRLLNEWDLALYRTVARPRPSGVREILHEGRGQLNLVKGWEPEPLELFSTDFTELRYAGGRKKAHLMAMLDVGSAWVPGWAVGTSANRDLALQCWENTQQSLQHLSRAVALPEQGHGPREVPVVHSDQDTVYTSYDWLRRLIVEDGVILSFSENGAKDNPWIESFWSRFKAENHSLLIEAQTLAEVIEIVGRQIGYYNTKRRHSRLAYMTPLEYLHTERMLSGTRSRN
jgi:putative transposase